jgi:hypothetical protein
MWAIASSTILTAARFLIWRGSLALIVLQPIPGARGKTPLGATQRVRYDKTLMDLLGRELARKTRELPACGGIDASAQTNGQTDSDIETASRAHASSLEPGNQRFGTSRNTVFAMTDELPALRISRG